MSVDRERLIAAFALLLDAKDMWRARQGEPGTYDMAGALTGMLTELLFASDLVDVVRHRVYADARDHDEDVPPADDDIQDGRELLRAMARLLIDLAQPIIAPVPASILMTDTLERAAGRSPIILGDGHTRPKLLVKAMRRRIGLAAHYIARRDGTNWLAEHAKILPGYSEETRRTWNRKIGLPDRELADAAGFKRGRQQPLTDAERKMEADVLSMSAEDMRAIWATLAAGGKID